MLESFDRDQYTIEDFIDLSKAFDTVHHSILLRKLELNSVISITKAWLKSSLLQRKQHIQIDGNNWTNFQFVKYRVPQGSILGPSLFLICVNDLKSSSTLLDQVMFTDYTNLFCTHTDINQLFTFVNNELKKMTEWLIANKFFLTVKKRKYSFFQKSNKKNDTSYVLSKLKINEKVKAKTVSIRFQGILLDWQLLWNEHTKYIQNKIAKSIRSLYN